MKINYTMDGLGLTGGVRVLLEIANMLVEKGHDVTVTSLGHSSDLWWFPLKAKLNCCGYYNTTEQTVEGLSRAIPDCDINVAGPWRAAFAVHRSGKGIPFYHMQHYEPLFSDKYYLQKVIEETYCLPANKIANSLWLKEQLSARHSQDVVAVVNPAIDHSVFYPRSVKKAPGKKRVVSLGRPIRWKGFPEAMEAMKIVIKNRRNVEFVVFGTEDLPYADPEMPYTFIRSPLNNELAMLYSECDVAISASWYESFPLPPLEAMACGIPVVTTKIGTEDYAHDGVNSIVVPPRDPQSLADAIIRLLDDEQLGIRLVEKGVETAKKFTWENTVDKIEKLFRGAISMRDSSPEEIIKYKDEQIRQRDSQLRELEEKERLLEEKERLLEVIYNSWSWRITSPLRWIYGLLTRGKQTIRN